MANKQADATEVSIKESFAFAKQHGVLITNVDKQHACIVHRPNPNSQILLEINRYLKLKLALQEVSTDRFMELLTQTYEQANSALQMAADINDKLDLSQLIDELPDNEDLLETKDDAPIIRLLNALLSEAIKLQVSDIHIETFEQNLVVRFRHDGVLQEVVRPQRILAPLLVSRIKVMAKLDIAEKRLPQDGRITLHIGGRPVDVRVSTMPASHGERVVLRVLDKKAARLDLSELGMGASTLTAMKALISKPHGIILVTGPTGSGKTTTLYAVLTRLNDVSRNILTVEDPIEYDLTGIGQMQVNNKVNMTFARGLRAMLRQDPDVVMVGEIRDLETAEIAVQASLTGHLVLSTLHTNSAVGAVTRLHDMGVQPFLLSSSVIGIVAQRLIRLLCEKCKRAITATSSECKLLACDVKQPPLLYHAVGCEHCGQTGYAGRTGIYELISVDDELRNMIHEAKSEQHIEKYVRQFSPSMREDGCRRVLTGETTLEEVLRVTSED